MLPKYVEFLGRGYWARLFPLRVCLNILNGMRSVRLHQTAQREITIMSIGWWPVCLACFFAFKDIMWY